MQTEIVKDADTNSRWVRTEGMPDGMEIDVEDRLREMDNFDITDIRAPWWDLIESTPVNSVMATRPLVTMKSDEKVPALFDTLSRENIHSVIVVDSDTSQVRGFVDVTDILRYFLDVIRKRRGKEESSPTDPFGLSTADFLKSFGEVTVGSLINVSEHDEMNVVDDTAPLVIAMRIFEKGVHHLAVRNAINQLIGIISQSDVIRFLAKRGRTLGRLIDNMIGSIANKKVLTIEDKASVHQAMELMDGFTFPALAVVDRNGLLVSTFSASDLRLMDPNMVGQLGLSVKEFLSKLYGQPKAPVVVRMYETVEHVMLKIVVHGVHRVWIVDAEEAPIGLITLTDVIHFLLIN